MSVKQSVKEHKDGTISIDLCCDRCGGRLIGSDHLGMHCAKRCYDKENKEAGKKLAELLGDIMKEFT